MEYSEIAALKENILASLHCALPGTVVSYDEEAQTAVIQPAICRVPQRQNVRDGSLVPRAWNGENDVTFHQPSSATGGGFETPLMPPLLRDVPVFMPVPFEVNEGDACLVIFADCDIDAWFESGEAEVPESGRMHSLSDGFAFVGFKVGGNGE